MILMKKQKNEELNFLYMNEKYQDKPKKKNKEKLRKSIKENKKDSVKSNNSSKKRNKKVNNIGADPISAPQNDKFNFDNEIIIGVTRIPDENKKKRKSNKTKNKSKQNSKERTSSSNSNKKEVAKNSINSERNKKRTKKKVAKKTTKKARIIKGIIKWTILLSALIASFIYFMSSPLFNLASIEVVNNEKISTDTIKSLSELKIGENIYNFSSKKVEQNIKQNAYIEKAEISRKLPNKVILTVKERQVTYQLEYANSYAYINNQGYILEISEQKEEVPIITGYTTEQNEIEAGNRLNSEDLEKLETVLKIMKSATLNDVDKLITKIDIKNKQKYILILENENKMAYIGDASNLSNRMLYLKAIIEDTRGLKGEIFINGELNKKDAYFRKSE